MKVDKRSIESFIRVRRDMGWTDKKTATQLHVGISTVCHWRHHFRIPPADKFSRKFKEKYGDDALEVFHSMVEKKADLQEIANLFGFTREYARQVHLKLYKKPYGRDHLKKMVTRR